MAIPTEVLKRIVERLYNVKFETKCSIVYPYRESCTRGSHPTRGVIVPVCALRGLDGRTRNPPKDELFEMLRAFAKGDTEP